MLNRHQRRRRAVPRTPSRRARAKELPTQDTSAGQTAHRRAARSRRNLRLTARNPVGARCYGRSEGPSMTHSPIAVGDACRRRASSWPPCSPPPSASLRSRPCARRPRSGPRPPARRDPAGGRCLARGPDRGAGQPVSRGARPGHATVDATLSDAATWKARHMAQYGYFAHDDPAPPVARSAYQRALHCGFRRRARGARTSPRVTRRRPRR